MKRQKSISSQAASISAWCAVFDWPSIVAALIVDAPRGREQLGGLEEHRGAVLPRPVGPLALRLARRRDRLLDQLGRGPVPVGQHVAVVVRHHDVLDQPGLDALAADDDRDLDALLRHRAEARLELGAFGGSGRVGADGLVDGGGNSHPRILPPAL